MKWEISIASPQLIIPQNSMSQNLLLIDLGFMEVFSQFEKVKIYSF